MSLDQKKQLEQQLWTTNYIHALAIGSINDIGIIQRDMNIAIFASYQFVDYQHFKNCI